MKKTIFFIAALSALLMTSCVSKSNYKELEDDVEHYKYLYQDAQDSYEEEHNERIKLINEYNDLVDEYNSLNSIHSNLKIQLNEQENIINRAKSATDNALREVQNFNSGWSDVYSIKRSIEEIRSKLDGWL